MNANYFLIIHHECWSISNEFLDRTLCDRLTVKTGKTGMAWQSVKLLIWNWTKYMFDNSFGPVILEDYSKSPALLKSREVLMMKGPLVLKSTEFH